MTPQHELTAEDIRLTLQEVAQEHLPFEADGYICTDEMIYDVLMKAATEGISIDAVCRDLADSAAGNTIRKVINAQLGKSLQWISCVGFMNGYRHSSYGLVCCICTAATAQVLSSPIAGRRVRHGDDLPVPGLVGDWAGPGAMTMLR